MKILVVGDVHGESPFMQAVFQVASQHGIADILQVGDFGYWPHTKWGEKFLREVETFGAAVGTTVWWIDGNHENHEWLRLKRKRPDGAVPISEHCIHLPRGYRWDWDGVRFGALGGAFSVDWRERDPLVSWWPQEVTTYSELVLLGEAPLDVLVTHDCPAGVELPSHWRMRVGDQEACDTQRELLAEAVRQTGAKMVLHGHWHHRHTSELPSTPQPVRVEGLANDGCGQDSMMVLDLDELKVPHTA